MSIVVCTLSLVNAILAANREILLRRTFWACAQVESGGDPRAFNLKENAAGLMQIRPIMVRDANRIIGREKWTLADRWNVEQSWQMFRLIVRYYHPKGSPEQWARTWNGGGKGAKKTSTLAYWAKVAAALKAIP